MKMYENPEEMEQQNGGVIRKHGKSSRLGFWVTAGTPEYFCFLQTLNRSMQQRNIHAKAATAAEMDNNPYRWKSTRVKLVVI